MGFIDLYPDNKNRARRVQELSDDCNNYLIELNQTASELSKAIKSLSDKSKEMLEKLGVSQDSSKLKIKHVDIDTGVGFEVVEFIGDIVGGIAVQTSVSMAVKLRLAQNLDSIAIRGGGNIAGESIVRRAGSEIEYEGIEGIERIAIKELRFPGWVRFSSEAAGVGAAIVFTIALDLIIDAIEGSDIRDKLQGAIKGMYGPRARMQLALTINRELVSLIRTTIGDMDDMLDMGYTKEQLEALVAKKAKTIKAQMDKETINQRCDEALAYLARLDKSRNSFTADDALDKSKCRDRCCWDNS